MSPGACAGFTEISVAIHCVGVVSCCVRNIRGKWNVARQVFWHRVFLLPTRSFGTKWETGEDRGDTLE